MSDEPTVILACVKSPKSDALPVDAIVTNSIAFVNPGCVFPPATTPRVFDEPLPGVYLWVNKSPKSVAFPSVAIVTNSITFDFVAEGVLLKPPALNPLVGDEKPVTLLAS